MNESHMRPVALITGSGRHRIGNRIARALGERGYQIGLHYNRSASEAQESLRELRNLDIETEAYQANVSDESEVDRMFDALWDRFECKSYDLI